MAEGQTPIEIFCSYAHEDEMWLRKLETHLSLLKRQSLISFWHNRLITPGTDWAKALDTHLETASVILLLVSADFFASDYCYGIEMKRVLEREAAGEARVVPILVRPADWTGAPFAHLQVLPTDARPITSWRNKDTALTDIAAGIRRVIVEELPQFTASASRATLPSIWNIPFPRNPFFLGRETELAQVRKQLRVSRATGHSQPLAISGLGGIGKTQLALEYAYRYHQFYREVLWVHAESAESMVSSYIVIARLLMLLEHKAKDPKIIMQAVKTWLQTHRDWLLILDNADELALLADFLPPTFGGHLLLTTRATATGRLAHRMEIETWSPERGALFLLRRAALLAPDAALEQASQEDREQALQISQELGGLPLALDQAGSYLEETGTDLASYWCIYQQHRTDLLRERRGLVSDHPESIATTWALSFQRVEERNPAAADLLRLCAFLSPDAIAEEILTAGASFLGPVLSLVTVDTFLLNQAIEALRAYSLLRRDPKEKILSIHRLVQTVLQDTLGETERRNWAERAMLAVNAAFLHAEYDTWLQRERLLSHALLAAQHIEEYQFVSVEAGRLLYQTAWYLKERARYQEAEPLYQQALRIQEPHLGSEHLDVATSLNGLAILHHEQGKYAKAEPLYQRALRIREQHLGSVHPDVAALLNNLANLYGQQGKYAEAEPLHQHALHISEQQLEAIHPNVAILLTNLADHYREQSAKQLSQRALLFQRPLYACMDERVYLRQDKIDCSPVAISLNNLAGLYCAQGKYGEAKLLYQLVLQVWEQHVGSEHLNVAYSLTGLANLYCAQGKYGEAELLYQRALHIWEQHLGPQHCLVAFPLIGLAILCKRQGKYAKAKVLLQRALHIREQALGTHSPKTTETREDLIALLQEMGQTEGSVLLKADQSSYEQWGDKTKATTGHIQTTISYHGRTLRGPPL